MKKKVGIVAEPFGFGPASKAFALANALHHKGDFEFHLLGKSVALEFFEKEEIPVYPLDWDEDYDIVINVLAPQYVEHFVRRGIPVFYVDSLGFLWNKAFLETFDCLNEVAAYFVQDAFGAFDNLHQLFRKKEVLHKVGAIVDLESTPSDVDTRHTVIQVGGLANPINSNAASDYLQLIEPIIGHFDVKETLVLCSSLAKDYLDTESTVRTLKHQETLWHYRSAQKVFTSPGLTTLLELGGINKNFFPLPPQNLSQLKILTYLNEHQTGENALLEELLSFYPRREFATEEEGVNYVKEVNRQYRHDGSLADCYLKHVDQGGLQPELIESYQGIEDCLEVILEYL